MNFKSFYASSTRPTEIVLTENYGKDFIYVIERAAGESDKGAEFIGFYTRDGNYVTSARSTVDFIRANDLQLHCDERLFRPDIALIGYSEKENAWFGITSASATFVSKFTVGDVIVKGMPGYIPSNESEYVESVLETLTPAPVGKITVNVCSECGVRGVRIQAENHDRFFPMPVVFGKGEWTAETIEDAKQMAIDYVNQMHIALTLDVNAGS